MNNKLITTLKEKLESERDALEKELENFAQKDKTTKGDWDTIFPKHNGGTGSQAMEDAAEEVEEYVTKLPIEFSLETRLGDINLALEKISKGKYGICEKCGKKISEERLKICPEARTCLNCQK